MSAAISHVGEMAALGAAACWTVTALVFEAAGRRVGSLSVNLIRLVIAFGFLAIYGAVARGQPLPVDATPRAWSWLLLSGLIGFVFGDLCLFRALVVLGSRLALLVMALVPPLSALLGFVVLDERLEAVDLAGMALTVAGVAWVVLERPVAEASAHTRRERVIGVLLAFGGAVGQAGGLVCSKLGIEAMDPFAATQIRVLAGIAGFALIFVFIGWWPKVVAACRNLPALGFMSVGAGFGPFLGVSLSLIAVSRTSTGVAATIMALTPVLIIPVVVLLGRERVSPRAAVGALLAVAGSGLLFLT
jgi:drug/metabolite transporter (DMT)-like permease